MLNDKVIGWVCMKMCADFPFVAENSVVKLSDKLPDELAGILLVYKNWEDAVERADGDESLVLGVGHG